MHADTLGPLTHKDLFTASVVRGLVSAYAREVFLPYLTFKRDFKYLTAPPLPNYKLGDLSGRRGRYPITNHF